MRTNGRILRVTGDTGIMKVVGYCVLGDSDLTLRPLITNAINDRTREKCLTIKLALVEFIINRNAPSPNHSLQTGAYRWSPSSL